MLVVSACYSKTADPFQHTPPGEASPTILVYNEQQTTSVRVSFRGIYLGRAAPGYTCLSIRPERVGYQEGHFAFKPVGGEEVVSPWEVSPRQSWKIRLGMNLENSVRQNLALADPCET